MVSSPARTRPASSPRRSRRRPLRLDSLEDRTVPTAVALLGADDTSWVDDVRNKLLATGQFSSVDELDVMSSTPTLAQLEAYNAVLVWNDFEFADETTLGNNLADYVDAGHGVVVATFANANSFFPPLLGRWAADGYDAITPSDYTGFTPLTLGSVAQPGHPIMAGVTNFSGGNASWHSLGGVSPGSSLIANWSDGSTLVAERSGLDVGLNFFPPSSDVYPDGWDSSTQGGLLMANALTYVSGFGARAVSPANGDVVFTPPTDFVVGFSAAYDPATVDAGDLTVNGIPADSVTLTDATTVTFHFDASPVTAQGLQSIHIADGAVDSLDGGDGTRELNASFRYDAVLMQVTSTNPPAGSTVTLPFTTLDLTFNEPFDPASARVSDFAVSQGSVVGVTPVDADTLRLTLTGVNAEGPLSVSMAAGAMTDVFGNAGAAFSAGYTLDFGTFPFPTPLGPVAPAGSLVHDGHKDGTISPAGDTDSFSILVDPGQKITAVVTPQAPFFGAVGNGSFDAGALIRLNAGNGSGSIVGDPVTPGGLTGLAFDPSAGALFGSTIQGAGSTSKLVTIDPATGALLATIGQIRDGAGGPAISIGDLALQPGTNVLYGIRSNTDFAGRGGLLYTIDKATGVATFVGDTGAGANGGIAFGPDGSLYQTAYNNHFDFTSLNTLDPSTAARLATVPISGYFDGLGVRPSDGALFAVAGGSDDSTYSINPANGAVTFVGRTGAGSPSDLAFGTGMAPVVEIRDSAGTLIGTASAAAGHEAVLQNVATTGQLGGMGPGPQTYVVTVSGANGTTGDYSVRMILNAAVEAESHGGAANDTRATAQSLEPSFLSFNAAVGSTQGSYPGRGAVLGRHDAFTASTVFSAGFEDGDDGFTVDNTPPPDGFHLPGQWHLSTGRGSQPGHSASHSFYYGHGEGPDGGGTYSIGQFNPTVGDLISPSIALPTGGALSVDFNYVLGRRFLSDEDTVALQVNDGSGWTTLVQYTTNQSSWARAAADLTAYAGKTVQLRWHFDTNRGPRGQVPEGWYVDDVRVRQFLAVPDYYSFNLRAGESATLAVKGAGASVSLENAAGATLATGTTGAKNLDSVISDFVAPVAGTYYARVVGVNLGGTDYNLVVTRNAAFDTEDNSSIATAQNLMAPQVGGRQWALGSVEPPTGLLFTVDGNHPFSIQQIDPVTGAITQTIPTPIQVGGGPDGLAFDGNHLWLVNSFVSDHLYEIDPATGTLVSETSLNSPGFIDGVAALAGKIYISNSDTNQILQFDPATHTVTGVMNIAADLAGGLAGITGPNALIASLGFNSIAEIDPATGTITNIFNPNLGSVLGVAAAGGNIYIGGFFNGVDEFTRDGTFIKNVPYASASITALGGDDVGGGPGADVYRVSVGDLKTLDVSTALPARQSGEFVNTLDPIVRIYNAAGTLVASDDNSDPDGRDAHVSYKVPKGAGGIFYIEVSSSPLTAQPTSGEYVLSVKGASAPPAGSPLHAAAASATPSAKKLTVAAARSLLGAAERLWRQAGFDTSLLGKLDIRVTDLGGTTLGMSSGRTIWLDDNAAGWGWFVDHTPGSDSEFRAGNPAALGRIDLLTVLVHEVGHLLGLGHAIDGVMMDTLGTGVRRKPGMIAV